MRTMLVVGFAANLVLAAVSAVLVPGNVAIHFGAGGEPDGWGPAHTNAIFMTGLSLLMFAMFFLLPKLIRITPARWVNLPNKEYWYREEHKARMTAMLTSYMDEFGAMMFAFLFFVGVLALQANMSRPVHLREDLMWLGLGLFLAYTVYWLVRFMLAFRVPKTRT